MVELLVVVVSVTVVGTLIFTFLTSKRNEQQRRTSCGNNLGNLIKVCHLYSDAYPNLGMFPLCRENHGGDGQKALAKLNDAYVCSDRVFSCPSAPTNTNMLYRYHAPDESWLQTDYTNYGYDPGHKPTHSTVDVLSDLGQLHPWNGNSTNHGGGGPGQNVALCTGAVEWRDSARRTVKTVMGRAETDNIFQDDLSADLPESLETCIVR
jgi:hypothetical protein